MLVGCIFFGFFNVFVLATLFSFACDCSPHPGLYLRIRSDLDDSIFFACFNVVFLATLFSFACHWSPHPGLYL